MPQKSLRTLRFVACGLLCALSVVLGTTVLAAQATPVPAHDGTILVFPFDNASDNANLEWLGEGLAEITMERLEDRHLNVLSRQERLAALEKMGLPATAEFSHATMIKIAVEADADEIIFGQYFSKGKNVTLQARVLHISPPSLSRIYTQTGPLEDLLRMHGRLAWQLVCEIDKVQCPPADANLGETIFTEPPQSVTLDAFETFSKGLLASDDEARLQDFREAARQAPTWDRPPFEVGQVYFARKECESALPWYSHVPPDRPDGPEASFNTGVCLLLTKDLLRAQATFSAFLDRVRSHDPVDHLPDLPEFHNNLGVALLRQGKWADAAAEFTRANTLDAEEPDYPFNLGIAWLAANQPSDALTALENAWKLDPDDNGITQLLMSALVSQGRTSEADAIRPSGAPEADPLPKDPLVLAQEARISMKLDRALLRPSPDAPLKGSSPPASNTPSTGTATGTP